MLQIVFSILSYWFEFFSQRTIENVLNYDHTKKNHFNEIDIIAIPRFGLRSHHLWKP